jgi:superfamily I DNA/RNA helicase
MSTSGWWREPDDMDEEQKRIFGLPSDGRYLVSGKPGSGKTNLLVLRASYLVRSGLENVKILTWGRLIIYYIASGSGRHGLDPSHYTTFKSWGVQALREAGVRTNDIPAKYPEMIRYLLERLVEANERGNLQRYDAILLDEVQDYPREAIDVLASLAPRLFIVGDERQRIFSDTTPFSHLEECVDEVIYLPFHYRNGRRICRVAEGISGESDYTSTSHYDESALPSSVNLHRLPSLSEQVELLKTEIRGQLRSYPNQLIGVMVFLNDHVDRVVDMLRADATLEPLCQFQTRTEGNEPLSDDKPIVVSTVHQAKGLEYRAAHIVGMEGLLEYPTDKRVNAAYTAVTRAKTSLSGYYTGKIPNWLASAFRRGQDPTTPPRLEDVF